VEKFRKVITCEGGIQGGGDLAGDWGGRALDYGAKGERLLTSLPTGEVETLFLNGDLSGKIYHFGMALTPAAKESRARVGRITASADAVSAALAAGCEAVSAFCDSFLDV
jgi:hypothetical protein